MFYDIMWSSTRGQGASFPGLSLWCRGRAWERGYLGCTYHQLNLRRPLSGLMGNYALLIGQILPAFSSPSRAPSNSGELTVTWIWFALGAGGWGATCTLVSPHPPNSAAYILDLRHTITNFLSWAATWSKAMKVYLLGEQRAYIYCKSKIVMVTQLLGYQF